MVIEISLEEREAFKCMKCGWVYNSYSAAKECEDWCKNSKSCDIKLIKNAIRMR